MTLWPVAKYLPAAALAIYLATAAILFVLQRHLVFMPDTRRPEAGAIGVPALQTLQLATPQGQSLLAWYIPPPQGGPVLAYFHGNGGNLGDRRDRLRLFAAAGLGVLMPEYPGYGGNPGTPSQTGFDQAATDALAFLQRSGIENKRVVIYGESIGTGVATRVAAGRVLAGLVLESPFTSLTDIARHRFPFLPVAWLLRDPFDQLSSIGQVRCPILILQGSQDSVVPPALGRRLFDAALKPKTLWVAPQGSHTNLFSLGGARVVIDFIRQVTAP